MVQDGGRWSGQDEAGRGPDERSEAVDEIGGANQLFQCKNSRLLEPCARGDKNGANSWTLQKTIQTTQEQPTAAGGELVGDGTGKPAADKR